MDILEYNGSLHYNKDDLTYELVSKKNKWIFPFGNKKIPVDLFICLPDFFIGVLFDAPGFKCHVPFQIIQSASKINVKINNKSFLPKKIHANEVIAKMVIIEKKECQMVYNKDL